MVTSMDGKTLAHSSVSGDALEHHVQLACLLEVSSAKPGNITPAHDFSDTTYTDMVRSALALGPAFARRRALRRGERDRPRHRRQHQSRDRAPAGAPGSR